MAISEAKKRHVLAPEKDFRWRAGEITRLEAFCDVVFGFAITLLVVSLEVPHNYAELIADVRGFLPFAVCFAQLALIWFTHYRFSRRYGLEDSYTVFLNVVLLFVVLFYVYPLKFLFTLLFSGVTHAENFGSMTFQDVSVLMRIYGVGLASVYVLFLLMHRHAYALRQELELNEVEAYETRLSMQENLAMVLFGVVSFFVAFIHPAVAGWMYSFIGVFYWIHGSITGKRKKLLSAKLSTAGSA